MSTPASPPAAPETRSAPARTISDVDFYKDNGYKWDYCLVFSIKEQTEEATQFQKEWSMQKICQRLVNAGLEIKMFYSSNKDSKDPKEERMVFCKIRADLDRLKQEADRIDYKLRLDPHTLRQKVEDGWPARPAHKSEADPHQYLIQPATIEDIKGASKRSPYDNIYGKYEQDGPGAGGVHEKSEADGGVDEMLYYSWGKSATGNRQIFRSVDRIKLIMSILEAPLAVSGCKIDFDKLKRPNGPRSKPKEAAIKANYPLHDDLERNALQVEWMNPWSLPNNQPLEGIKNYFGEKVALYFGWLGHYTTWLSAPAFVGFVIQILVWKAGNPDVPALAVFGVFMCLWSTFFPRILEAPPGDLRHGVGHDRLRGRGGRAPRVRGRGDPQPNHRDPHQVVQPSGQAEKAVVFGCGHLLPHPARRRHHHRHLHLQEHNQAQLHHDLGHRGAQAGRRSQRGADPGHEYDLPDHRREPERHGEPPHGHAVRGQPHHQGVPVPVRQLVRLFLLHLLH
jgi:hypothetical protein